jgi:hypothetical protein
MADIVIKYKKLVEAAQRLIQIDNSIIDATKRGDESLMQAMNVTRAGIVRQIEALADFKP